MDRQVQFPGDPYGVGFYFCKMTCFGPAGVPALVKTCLGASLFTSASLDPVELFGLSKLDACPHGGKVYLSGCRGIFKIIFNCGKIHIKFTVLQLF